MYDKGSEPFSDSKEKFTKEIMCHMQAYYCHKSLGTKVLLERHGSIDRLNAGTYIPRRDLGHWMKTELKNQIKRYIAGGSDLVMYVGENKSSDIRQDGGAGPASVCGQRDEIKVSISQATTWIWRNYMPKLAELLAHEIGHNLGMEHDFEKRNGGKRGHCNCKGIMSYGYLCHGRKIPLKWSTCSGKNFKRHYMNIKRQGRWCLESKYSF